MGILSSHHDLGHAWASESNFSNKNILPSVPAKKNTFIGEKQLSSPAHKDSAKVHSVAVSLVLESSGTWNCYPIK